MLEPFADLPGHRLSGDGAEQWSAHNATRPSGHEAVMQTRDDQPPPVLDSLPPGGGRIAVSETIVSLPSSQSVS